MYIFCIFSRTNIDYFEIWISVSSVNKDSCLVRVFLYTALRDGLYNGQVSLYIKIGNVFLYTECST